LVEGWHTEHVLKHDAAAIECFLLMSFLAFILFHAFLYLNVKPSLRKGKSKDFWARIMAAEIYDPSSHPPYLPDPPPLPPFVLDRFPLRFQIHFPAWATALAPWCCAIA
jgi:hypothetical protein